MLDFEYALKSGEELPPHDCSWPPAPYALEYMPGVFSVPTRPKSPILKKPKKNQPKKKTVPRKVKKKILASHMAQKHAASPIEQWGFLTWNEKAASKKK